MSAERLRKKSAGAVPRAGRGYAAIGVRAVRAAARARRGAERLRAFPPAGALLLLPDVRGKTYTVCAGETLPPVCEKFGLTEESFCRMNACSYVYPTQLVLVGEG